MGGKDAEERLKEKERELDELKGKLESLGGKDAVESLKEKERELDELKGKL